MTQTLTPEQFEEKLYKEFKDLIKNKDEVVKLLDEANQYASSIKMPDTYEQLAINILEDVRKHRKFTFKQWKSVNLFVVNQRKLNQSTSDDDFIIL